MTSRLQETYSHTIWAKNEGADNGNRLSLELLEDEIRAVVRARDYQSKREAISHALEVLLAANPLLRLNTAIELYR